MKPEEKIETLINQIDVTPDETKYRQTLDAMLDAQAESEPTGPAGSHLSIWRILMKSTTTKYAAAVILFAGALVFMQVVSTPKAFAIERTAQAIGVLETLHVAGIHLDENGRMSQIEIWTKAHSQDPTRSGDFREEVKGKRISVVSESVNTTWRYYPQQHQVYILSGLQNSVKPFWPDGNFFLELKKNARQWQEVLCTDENGQDCVLVTCSYVLERLPDRKFDFRIVFDAETMLPVRMNLRDLSTSRGPQEYQFDVIEFNEAIPEENFAFNIPEGIEIFDQR
jgi:hypothetical protein